MDDTSRGQQPVMGVSTWFYTQRLGTHGIHYLLKRILHMLGLLDFMLRPIIVKPQDWDAELVDRAGVNIAIVIILRDALPSTGHPYGGTIKSSDVLFQSGPISPVRSEEHTSELQSR